MCYLLNTADILASLCVIWLYHPSISKYKDVKSCCGRQSKVPSGICLPNELVRTGLIGIYQCFHLDCFHFCHASETASTFPLGQQTIFSWWGNAGPLPVSWSWYGTSSIRDILAGLASLNVTDTVSANRSFCVSPLTLLCTSTKCHCEPLPCTSPSSSSISDSVLVKPLSFFLSSLLSKYLETCCWPCFLLCW